jgi:hypothetical protein
LAAAACHGKATPDLGCTGALQAGMASVLPCSHESGHQEEAFMKTRTSMPETTTRRSRIRAASLALVLSFAITAWAQVPGEKVVGGIVFRLGIAPSEQVSSEGTAEREMHQPRARRDRDHLVVSLAEEGSGKRIGDARVTASVSRMGTDHARRELQRMQTGSVPSYGEYFDFRALGPYRIRVEVRRPGTPAPTVAEFDYDNR